MNYWGFLSVVTVCAAGCWAIHTLTPVLRSLLVSRQESPVTPTLAPTPVSAPDTVPLYSKPVPKALLDIAMQESEPWAREGVVKAMYEMYDVTQDWGAVQAIYMTGEAKK